jgi:hypothetical protein
VVAKVELKHEEDYNHSPTQVLKSSPPVKSGPSKDELTPGKSSQNLRKASNPKKGIEKSDQKVKAFKKA